MSRLMPGESKYWMTADLFDDATPAAAEPELEEIAAHKRRKQTPNTHEGSELFFDAAVLADMGLTVSDVVRIVLTKIAKNKALPFEMLVPNKTTVETIEKSEHGEEVYYAKDAKDLFDQLGI